MAISIDSNAGANPIARVLILDAATSSMMEHLLTSALKDSTYLDAVLTHEDIHLLKSLAVITLRDSKGVPEPLALWERELYLGAENAPLTYEN